MPDKKFELGDYIEVKDRIAIFYELYPQGRLVTAEVKIMEMGGTPYVMVGACAYRTPDDPLPGTGTSWMAVPGSTPYTRGSEVENTETSAWGRAIASLGILIDRSIASAQEVANKEAGPQDTQRMQGRTPVPERDGLIGTIEAGKPPVDMSLRLSPDGAIYGFKLKNGSKAYQVMAEGGLATALGLLGPKVGARATVWGRIVMVPWEKGGKPMPPYPRIDAERMDIDGEPVVPVEPSEEAESVPAFAPEELDLVETAG